jgi:hypothetical protein
MQIDPRKAKLLGDLLALTLSSETGKQADGAIEALRRRAATDEVTGGALKEMVTQLLEAQLPEAERPNLHHLQWTIAEQQRDLDEVRHARRDAEAALSDIQRTHQTLAAEISAFPRQRMQAGVIGVLLGLASAAIIAAGIWWFVLLPHQRAIAVHNPGLDEDATAAVVDFLHSCFESSINNLGGTGFDMHVALALDATGRVTSLTLAPDQAAQLANDRDRALYSEMVTRTLTGNSCGPVPLPPSLRGKPNRLDLYLSH